jgi:hypothetical protein
MYRGGEFDPLDLRAHAPSRAFASIVETIRPTPVFRGDAEFDRLTLRSLLNFFRSVT